MLLFWTCGIAAFVVLVYNIIWYFKLRILVNKLPGPPAHPILGNWMDIHISTDKLWNLLRDLANRYPPVYRLWSGPIPAVAFLEPEDVELLLSTTKHIKKSKMYYFLEPWLGTGLLTSTGPKWQSRRKILTPGFHFSILQQFIPVFTEQSQLLVNNLKSECDKPYSDLVPIINKFTLHSICETAMGIRLHEAKTKQDNYAKSIYKMGELVVHRILSPWYYLDIAYVLSPEFWQKKKLVQFLHNFSNAVISERKVNYKDINVEQEEDGIKSKKRLAMLDLLIAAQKAGVNIDDEGIREEVDTFMFEGHDTTSSCICFTLFLLANNPHIQEKVREEILDVFDKSDRAATYQDLQNMTYLEMVLKESLRIYPSVPLIARVTDEPITTKSGYVIPGWVFVHIYIYDLHHNPKVFPNPSKFDPDRFLPQNCQTRHPFAYLPFSAGPRNCIGQKFAMLEIKTVISSILRKYQVVAIDKPEDLVLVTDLIMRSKNGIKIKFEKI